MSVTAQQLSKSGARGKELDNIVRDHLQIIDDKLLKAGRSWGRNVVSHDLPTMLNLPGLEKKDGQRIVYSSILRSLDDRGFETRILLEQKPERTTIYIAWMTDLDSEEVEAMSALIRSRRIVQDDLAHFLKYGAVEAPRAATTVRHGRAKGAPPMTVVSADQVMNPRGGLGLAVGEVRTPVPTSTAELALLGGQ
jgi:hypothetical protein